MQVRSAIVLAAVLYPTIKQNVSEIMVDGRFLIVAVSETALEEIVFWGIDRVDPPVVPLHILDNRIAHRDVAILVVLGVNHMKHLIVKIDILHAKPKGFRYP